jgi:hypothetical protein
MACFVHINQMDAMVFVILINIQIKVSVKRGHTWRQMARSGTITMKGLEKVRLCEFKLDRSCWNDKHQRNCKRIPLVALGAGHARARRQRIVHQGVLQTSRDMREHIFLLAAEGTSGGVRTTGAEYA